MKPAPVGQEIQENELLGVGYQGPLVIMGDGWEYARR